MAESYLDQGLEGWVDAHSAPHMAIQDIQYAVVRGRRKHRPAGLQIWVLTLPTAGAPDHNIVKDTAWIKLSSRAKLIPNGLYVKGTRWYRRVIYIK
jgi:hypothetical protein